ncbi:MAG: toxin-antitoxin system HicB family antitoxin [Pirellulaceae bacterium]|nr:toxin-antitoxin system HicB family antitoxin [Pirellulaceae bacterium]
MNEMNSMSMNPMSSNPPTQQHEPTEDFATRCQKILGVAKQLFHGNPDWVTFFREVLGVDGAARSVFKTQKEYISFEKSPEFTEIQALVNALRNRKVSPSTNNEPTRVITVRLPESLHEALKAEANDHNTSMNKLCISKLLQVLAENSKTVIPTRGGMGAGNTAGMGGGANFRSSYQPENSVGNHSSGTSYR